MDSYMVSGSCFVTHPPKDGVVGPLPNGLNGKGRGKVRFLFFCIFPPLFFPLLQATFFWGFAFEQANSSG